VESLRKIYLGQDPDLDPGSEPDPNILEIRIRKSIVRIRNTAKGVQNVDFDLLFSYYKN
jgi:hypothetical protein